jgi:hypothetical protein
LAAGAGALADLASATGGGDLSLATAAASGSDCRDRPPLNGEGEGGAGGEGSEGDFHGQAEDVPMDSIYIYIKHKIGKDTKSLQAHSFREG